MPLLKHLVTRFFLILLGYFVSVIAGLVAVAVFYMALSSLPGAPDYFAAMSVTPIVVLAVPPVALFVYLITIVLTGVQALVAVLFAEFFELRTVFVHALFGLTASVSGFMFASPTILNGISATDWADIGIVGASGLVAGVFYWLIAGRGSGFRPDPVIGRVALS